MESAQPCPQCEDLRTWDVARGPGSVLLRIQAMLSFVGRGFEEVRPPGRANRHGEWLWSQLPPEDITEPVVQCGNSWDRYVPAAIALRCDACGTVFSQTWSFDRGNERWTVTPPTA